MRDERRRRITGGATAAALGVLLALPGMVGATPGLSEKADSTYRLVPREGHVKVNIVLRLVNQKAPTTSVRPCSGNPAQRCRVTTSYYWDRWGLLFVPTGATRVTIKGAGVRSNVHKTTRHWTSYELTFPNLNFRQSKVIRISYRLGGKPRAKHRTRVLEAYSYFCWHGEPSDSGRVQVILPPGYEATTYNEKTRTKRTKKRTIIIAKRRNKPQKVFACTDAVKPSALLRTEIEAPGGGRVIVEAWPEDPDWSAATTAVVTDAVTALEELLGRPMPTDELTLREVPRRSLYGYGFEFGPRLGIVRLGDHVDGELATRSAVASAWFNGRRIADTWLMHGLANWAGHAVGPVGCWFVSEYPRKSKPKLRTWITLSERPTDVQEATVDWQFQAACNAVQRVASRIGPERMRDVVGAILDGGPIYAARPGSEPAPRKAGKATWKRWLDAADELGLAPAGVDDLMVAQQHAIDVGIATEKQLRGRSAARTAYHEALAAMGETAMPLAVANLMDRWRFKDARKLIPVAAETYAAIVDNVAMDEADRAGFLERFEAARSAKALRALAKEATAFESVAVPEPEPPVALVG